LGKKCGEISEDNKLNVIVLLFPAERRSRRRDVL